MVMILINHTRLTIPTQFLTKPTPNTMKKHENHLSMLLSEQIPHSQLAKLTGGTNGGGQLPGYPNDLVTPSTDRPSGPYQSGDPEDDNTSNPA